MKKKLIVGIIGGMGPAATCLLFDRIINNTPARCDQEHLHIIINNDPSVPDRTAAILGKGTSPVSAIRRSADTLVTAGADLLMIPCMTSHAFIDEVRTHINARIISAIEEISYYLNNEKREYRRIGVLATDGSLKAGVYEPIRRFVDLVFLSSINQKLFMDAIYGESGIKTVGANIYASNTLLTLVEELRKQGANAVIAGCTEVPVGLATVTPEVPIIDPIELLAKAAVREAHG